MLLPLVVVVVVVMLPGTPSWLPTQLYCGMEEVIGSSCSPKASHVHSTSSHPGLVGEQEPGETVAYARSPARTMASKGWPLSKWSWMSLSATAQPRGTMVPMSAVMAR